MYIKLLLTLNHPYQVNYSDGRILLSQIELMLVILMYYFDVAYHLGNTRNKKGRKHITK
jgi:hypothetical protein